MKTEIKTAGILTLTLIIGMVLGALIHGTVMQNRIKQGILRMRSHNGLFHRIDMILDLDESQRERVHEILLKHRTRMDKLHTQVRTMMDSLQDELEPILTEEQKARIKESPFFRKDPHFPPLLFKPGRGRMDRHPRMFHDSTGLEPVE